MKLNNAHRQKIRDLILERRYGSELERLDAADAQLALDIYDHVFSEDRSRMHELPHGWLPRVIGVKVQISGSMVELSFPRGTELPVPHDKASDWSDCTECIADLNARHELSKRYRAIVNDRATLVTERDQRSAEITGVLYSVTTVKRLLDEWPEIEDIVTSVVQAREVNRNLPTVRIDKLNKSLGLVGPSERTDTEAAAV